jgi:hypothetical protein
MAHSKEDLIRIMESSNSKKEWNKNCKRVKMSCGGRFPKWWYREILVSGIFDNVKLNWEF